MTDFNTLRHSIARFDKARRDGSIVDALQTRYEEGDVVNTPDGRGVVSGVWEQSWETDEESVEASDDSPAYTVALADGGFDHYKASDLERDEFPDPDVEEPLDDVEAMHDIFHATGGFEALQGAWHPPDSWEESETPARIIALDAWSSMGGQFDCGGACCKGTMAPKLGNRGSDEFCASFKDYILGTDLWRGWGPD